MPLLVNREQRRVELARAVWRVIRRDGIERASVREVAREAGLSTGSLRHYFSTQSELLVFAMGHVMEQVETRASAVQRQDDLWSTARLVLAELLPLDDERRAENEVWLAFTARAMVDPHLAALRNEAYDRLRDACVRWISLLLPGADETSRQNESERLFALIDGLAVHAAMRPASATAEVLSGVLNRHLDQLAAQPA
ncbi:TetR/AcrR family transcriptional regulator [Arthrobacter sp. 7Tela_A1]|uniref:TetR/AcrR family transcriptional regulator n=1 Tax=Arthrobacter sp. 7Tela_A1 TaxID=3093745 RepID=UPI003BB4E008